MKSISTIAGEFQIAFGTTPGGNDVMEFQQLEETAYDFCQDQLQLHHNIRYYATLIAINGATFSRNVTGFSDAGMYLITYIDGSLYQQIFNE